MDQLGEKQEKYVLHKSSTTIFHAFFERKDSLFEI
jgi:hypothetical protein